jgi:PAS domain S-box-containing protein
MSARPLNLLAPPAFENDPDKTFAAGLLNTILLAMLIGAILYGVGSPIAVTLLPLRLAYVGTFVLLVLGLLYLMRRGHVRFASWASVTGTWAILTIAALTSGGVLAPGFSGYIIPILCAGLLLGPRAGIGWAVLSIFSGGIMLYAGSIGALPAPVVIHDVTSVWLAQSVYFIVATVLLGLALHSITRALDRLRLEVAERKQAEQALKENEQRHHEMYATAQRQAQELTLLDKVRTALARELDLQALITIVVESIAETFGYALVSLYLLDEDTLVLQHQVGYKNVITRMSVTEGVMGMTARDRKPVLLEDIRKEPRFIGAIENITSEICIPLFDENETVGVLNVESTRGVKLSGADLQLMAALGEHVSVAIRRARLYSEAQKNEEKYRSLFENVPVGLGVVDQTGRFLAFNEAILRPGAYTRQDVLDLGNVEKLYYDPDDRKRVLAALRGTGEIRKYPVQFRRKDGTPYDTLLTLTPILFNGQPCIQALVEDVTQQKLAEKALAEEQGRFRALIENGMDGMALYTAGADILYQSPAIRRILGYEPEEVYGTNVGQFIHPDDTEKVGEAYLKVLESPNATVTTEARTRHKDGSYRWLEVIISNQLNEPGIQALVANYRDVTERKEAERVLQASEEEYRRLVEHSPYIVAIHSEGQLVYLNEAGVRLMRADNARELYGLPILDFVHPDSRPRVLRRLQELLEGKEAPPLEEKFLRRDGSVVHVEVTAYPYTYQGRPAVQVIIRDLTLQKEAEKALRASEERFSKAFHSSPIPTCITTLEKGVYLDVNEAYLKLSNWQRQDLIGHTSEQLNIYRTGERERFIERLLNKEVRQGSEEKFITSSGEVLDVAAFYELVELAGEICILSMFYDLTVQNRAREAVRSSEERIRAILDHTQNIYYSHTPDHMLTYMSGQTLKILGYEPAEALRDWHEYLTDHPINQRGIELSQKAIDTGQVQEPYVLELRAKNGRHVWVEVRESPIVRDGRTAAVVGAMTDISQREEAERRLERQLTELTVLHAVAMAGSQSEGEDEVIERATQIMNGMLYPDNCGILLLNRERTALSPHPSYRGASAESLTQEIPLSRGVTGRVATSGRPARIGDVSQEPLYVETTPGVCSELCVPIRVNEKIIGVLNAESRKSNAFDEEDQRVLSTIAGTLGTAIERIRLFIAEQKSRRQAENLREATMALTTTIELEKLYEIILDALAKLVPYTSASIEVVDQGYVKIAAARGLPQGGLTFIGRRYPFERGKWDPDFRKPIIVADAQTDARFTKLEGTEYIRGWMGVPMVAQDQLIAFLNLDSDKPDFYNQEHSALAQTFANQAAVAVKNAHLYKSEQRRYQEAEKLRQAATVVASSLNLKEVLETLLRALKDVVPYDSASILLPEGDFVRIVAANGLPHQDQAIGQLFPAGNQLLQQILVKGQPLILADAQNDKRFERWAASEHVRGWMGIPMIARGQVVGFITLDNLSPVSYDTATAALAQSFAHQAAAAVENAELFENLQKSNLELSQAYDTTLEGWGKALELKDKETQGHTQRVTELTVKLARRMGLGPAELVQIRRGVLVHDIGKMGVPDHILHKKGPLTRKEWAAMHEHPQYAFDLLYPISYLRPALDIAYCHHERWDGTGYPRGLKGEQIPLAARIFAVVDVWDALLSNRSYRKQWTKRQVLKHIRDGAGSHFDPEIVRVFLRMMSGPNNKK